MGFKSHFAVFKEYLKISLATAMEYRINFITQVSAMFTNDLVWVFFWWILFQRFEDVRGWGMQEMMMLYGVFMLSYGLAGFFFGNRNKMGRIIMQGQLDFFLPLPKNVLFHALTSRSSFFSLGDILFGLMMMILAVDIAQWPLFLLLSLLSTIILISYGILVGSLAFYFDGILETSRSLWYGLASFSLYPYSIYEGKMKLILLSVIPAGFVAGVPVELLQSFSWQWFLGLVVFTVVFFCICITVFYYGLKRYESGSGMQIRL